METLENNIEIEKENKIKEILWIEDDTIFVDKNKPLIEGKYFEFFKEKIKIDVAHNVADGIKKFKKGKGKYRLAMIDIEMDPPEKNGFIAMRTISSLSPQTKFIIVSANLKQPKWIDLLQTDRFKNIPNIEKPFSIAQSTHYKTMLETIKNNLHSNKEISGCNIDTEKEVDDAKSESDELDPFNFTFDEFINLPEEKINEIFEVASKINKDFTENHFKEHPHIDWIVTAKKLGNVIASGKSKNMPYEEDLMDMAKQIGGPVFTYRRPIVIEEFADSSWNVISNPEDYYPTVVLEFDIRNKRTKIKGDFDTGSPYSFISYEELLKKEIISKRIWQIKSKDKIWNKEYVYYLLKLQAELFGSENNKKIELRCNAVIDWESSPFCAYYKNRFALIGRDILLRNRIKILLDGDNKKTDFLK